MNGNILVEEFFYLMAWIQVFFCRKMRERKSRGKKKDYTLGAKISAKAANHYLHI